MIGYQIKNNFFAASLNSPSSYRDLIGNLYPKNYLYTLSYINLEAGLGLSDLELDIPVWRPREIERERERERERGLRCKFIRPSFLHGVAETVMVLISDGYSGLFVHV